MDTAEQTEDRASKAAVADACHQMAAILYDELTEAEAFGWDGHLATAIDALEVAARHLEGNPEPAKIP